MPLSPGSANARGRRRVVARLGQADGARLGLGEQARAVERDAVVAAEVAEAPCASSALVATLARAMFLNTCVTTS